MEIVFPDYVTLLLTNMVAGHFLLAAYLLSGMNAPEKKPWAAAFLVVGGVAVTSGLHMAWTWPLPGPFNSAFGEMSVLFGAAFLGAALLVWRNARLTIVGFYALFAGLAALLIGIRLIQLELTHKPILSGMGFICSGLAGVLAGPVFSWPKSRGLRYAAVVVLIAGGLIWALTAYGAFWMHMETFSQWISPVTLEIEPDVK